MQPGRGSADDGYVPGLHLKELLDRCSGAGRVLVLAPPGHGRTAFADLLVREATTGLLVQLEHHDRTDERVLHRLLDAAAQSGLAALAEAGRRDADLEARWERVGESLTRSPGPVTVAFDDVDALDHVVRARLLDLPCRVVLVAAAATTPSDHDGAVVVGAADLAATLSSRGELEQQLAALTSELEEAGHADLLPALAVLPVLSARVAAVLGDPELLARLDRARISLTPQRRPGWWRLPDQARRLLPDHGALDADVALAVATVYAEGGFMLHAIDVLVAAGRLDRLPAIVRALTPAVLDRLDLHQLSVLLTPASDGGADPDDLVAALLEVAEAAANRGDLDLHSRLVSQVEARVPMLESRLGRQSETQVLVRAVEAQRLRMAERDTRDVEAARELIARTERLLVACSDIEVRTRAVALLVRGSAAAWTRETGLRAVAQESLTQSAALFRLLGDSWGQASALTVLGYRVYAALGEVDSAVIMLEDASRLLPEQSRVRALCLTYLAEAAIAIGYDDVAERALDEAGELSRLLVDDMALGYVAWERAHLAAERGDAVACDTWSAVAERHSGQWSANRAGVAFHAQRVEWAAAQGRLEEARTRLQHATTHADRYGYPDQLLAAQGAVAALEGRFADAIGHYTRTLETRSAAEEWRTRLVVGWLHLQNGDQQSAREATAAVTTELEVMGHPELAQRREPDRWQDLRRLLAPTPDDTSSMPVAGPLVRVLGQVAVQSGDVVTTVPGSRPRALLVLLATARRPLRVDEVGHQLWPDLDPAVARRRLRNVFTRVRACGAVVERHGAALAITPGTRVDVRELEAAAERVLSARDTPDRGREALAALELYAGPLGGDEPAEAESVRLAAARVERLVVGLLELVVAGAIRRGDVDEAVRALARLADLDPDDLRIPARAAALLRAAGRESESRRFDRAVHDARS